MRSKWIEYRGKQIFYQDFSNLMYNAEALKQELEAMQQIVLQQPPSSTLVLADFRNTQITPDVMPLLNSASARTKSHVRKTAVLGVVGLKRTLGDLLMKLTGQPLKYFDNETLAKEWLTQDEDLS
uniref:STAS/SEC14 domain-containing protein n=1 Tax=uncultured Chloroflexota bacterium TaxID=166587 RepID=H5SQ52_9CHLR|nr:hypothetical protein HGMM_F55G01C16 [uncultured Chloroflexota bacterium]